MLNTPTVLNESGWTVCVFASVLEFLFLCTGTGCPKVSYLTDNTQHVVFSSQDPSLVLTYDTMVGVHSAWRIRKARTDVSSNLNELCHETGQGSIICKVRNKT